VKITKRTEDFILSDFLRELVKSYPSMKLKLSETDYGLNYRFVENKWFGKTICKFDNVERTIDVYKEEYLHEIFHIAKEWERRVDEEVEVITP
jgi:hypothetical protein